jgi:hypothetical protein
VSAVTNMETVSSPPARRVHTAADANVQGTAAVTNNPVFMSPVSNCANNHATNGNNTTLTIEPQKAGHGLRIESPTDCVSSGNAIMNNTRATMQLRSVFASAKGSNCVGKQKPKTKTVNNAARNH